MQEILIKSSVDGTNQPSLFFHPGSAENVPLVVGLHTWSHDRFNQQENYLPLARQYGFALLLPEFRGPNLVENPKRSEACGTHIARQDVLDAIEYVGRNFAIDREKIFLLGCSGGGHMSLLVAESSPETFRAVEVWCPVSDLVKWYNYVKESCLDYLRHIEACIGGTPESLPEEFACRSPISRAEVLKNIPVSIHHGRHDDVIPYIHSIAFAQKVEKAGNDQVYLDIFDGGHEQIPSHSFEWFAKLSGIRAGIIKITG